MWHAGRHAETGRQAGMLQRQRQREREYMRQTLLCSKAHTAPVDDGKAEEAEMPCIRTIHTLAPDCTGIPPSPPPTNTPLSVWHRCAFTQSSRMSGFISTFSTYNTHHKHTGKGYLVRSLGLFRHQCPINQDVMILSTSHKKTKFVSTFTVSAHTTPTINRRGYIVS